MQFERTVRRTPPDRQQSLPVTPAQAFAEVLPPTRTACEESEREHAALRASLAAFVEAAPVRAVLRAETTAPWRWRLHLECGHVAVYFAERSAFRCHACAGQDCRTRADQEGARV